MPETHRVAALDVGTNTVRLLVADVIEGEVVEIDRRLEITRLGRGVDAGRRLDPAATEQTLDVLRTFVDRARLEGTELLRVAGTSALRDAADRGDFARAVREAAGVDLEILSGSQEGRLAFRGATAARGDGPFLVCDIGGGSTELVRGGREPEGVWSMDVGSVRLRERVLGSDPPTEDEAQRTRGLVREGLQVARDALGVDGTEEVVGVAGTITTLASLVAGLQVYDPERIHGMRIGADAVRSWSERLLRMRVAEIREAHPVVPPGRADVICAGVLVCTELLGVWGYEELTVSEHDLLDGLVLDAVG